MRNEYNGKSHVFLEEHIEVKEPFDLFHNWFQLVKNDPRTVEPNSVFLSTCTRDGYPSGRVVLLKGYGKDGFRFFTHYSSRKGQELEENNRAALTFYWEHFHRSVRVEGDIDKLPFSAADEYFSQRPYESQIGSLCSDQSKPVASRDTLIAIASELKKKYKEGEVPKPPLWGGYLLKPKMVEFWQGQTDRVHDRIRFRFPKEGEPDGILTKQGEEGWIYERMEICECERNKQVVADFKFSSLGTLNPLLKRIPAPENSCIVWKCNIANHEDLRPNKPILITKDPEIEQKLDEPLQSKWIPVLPGVISQKSVNESKHLYCPF